MTAALDPLVAVIDERVRRAVDERLAELGLAPEYTSECRPASVSRRAFNTACRSGKISGAMKDGKTWRCSRIAWNEGRTRVPLKREEVAPPMIVPPLLH